MPKLPWLAGGGTNSRKKARAETKAQKSGTNGPVRDISATEDRHVEGRKKVRAAVDVVLVRFQSNPALGRRLETEARYFKKPPDVHSLG